MILIGDEGFFSTMENISAVGCCVHRPPGWSQLRGVPVRLFMNLGRTTPAVVAAAVWSNDNFVGFEYKGAQSLPPELLSITVGHHDS